MLHRIILIFIWAVYLIFTFSSYSFFLNSDTFYKKQLSLFLPLVSIAIVSAGLFLPEAALVFACAGSAVIIVIPISFYHAPSGKKAAVAIITYLSFMVTDMLSTSAAYLIQLIFTTVPVTGNILTNGSNTALLCYAAADPVLFLLCRCFILPHFKQFIDRFDYVFFLQITGPFLLIYLSSNPFLLLFYSDSVLLFVILSFVFFLFVCLMTKFALQSFRFFIKQEQEHTQKLLQREQFEQHTLHFEDLSAKYAEIRKQNHDISGHLTALSYLCDSGRWEDVSDYIRRLSMSYNHRYM